MQSGRLRHLLNLRAPPLGDQGASGQPPSGHTELGKVWAAVEPAGGQETVQADAVSGQTVYAITIRWRALPEGVKWHECWLYWQDRDRTFHIAVAQDRFERQRELVLTCREEV